MRTGANVTRSLVGGRMNEIGQQFRELTQQGTPPLLHRAVVLDVILNIAAYSRQQISDLKTMVNNPEMLDNAPSNSLIVKMVGQGLVEQPLPIVVYPFFQSHFSMPVQAGEHVHVLFEDFQNQGASLGYWMTRIHENQAVEDTNFTHNDRRFLTTNNESAERTSATATRGSNQNQQTPGFPNGGGTVESYTLPPSGSVGPYDVLYRNSTANRLHTFEPVPRFTKRPQEFVLQSMNNSLIWLGQDRTGSFFTEGNKTNAGAIDLVAGRGRYQLLPTDNISPTNKPTSQLVVRNTRGLLETDKTPWHRNRQSNIKEGDVDFERDAARLYIGMKTEGDTNFKLKQSTDNSSGIDYPDNTIRKKEPNAGREPEAGSASLGNSYLIGKSDHVRFVARTATTPDNQNIKGTILLLKEGRKDQDLAYLYFNSNGLAELSAPKLFLGKAATGDINTVNHQEPYIKWSKFKETVDELHEQINLLKQQLSVVTNALATTALTSMCSPYTPDPAWTGLPGRISGVGTELNRINSLQTNTNTKVQEAKSTIIFGS